MKFPAVAFDRFKTIGAITFALCSIPLWQPRPAEAGILNYEAKISGSATASGYLYEMFPSTPPRDLENYEKSSQGQFMLPANFAEITNDGQFQVPFGVLGQFLDLPDPVQRQSDSLLDQLSIDFAGTGNLRSETGVTPFSFRYNNPGDMDVDPTSWKTITVGVDQSEVLQSCLLVACEFDTEVEIPWRVSYLMPSQDALVPLANDDVALLGGDFRYVVSTTPPEQIPTPALLPGLVGVTVSLWRRKRSKLIPV